MDWFHCNKCYAVPGPGNNVVFHVSNCGHTFCEKCSLPTLRKCYVCGRECTMTPLNSQVKQEIREFFNDPGESMKKIQNVLDYQGWHRERLNHYLLKTNAKYQAIKTEYRKMQEELRKSHKMCHALKQENNWLKERERARNRFVQARGGNVHNSPVQRFCDLSPQTSTGGFQRINSSQNQLSQQHSSQSGGSRLTLSFRGSTPGSEMSSKTNPKIGTVTSGFSGMYRNHNSLYSSTPSPGGGRVPSVLSNLTPETVYNGDDAATFQRRNSLPSNNGTPTEALKILSIAYGKNNR